MTSLVAAAIMPCLHDKAVDRYAFVDWKESGNLRQTAVVGADADPEWYSIMQIPKNPFSPTCPVAPDLFIGRDEQLSDIANCAQEALTSRKPKVIAITGMRGVGKTSLRDKLVKDWSAPAAGRPRLVIGEVVFPKVGKLDSGAILTKLEELVIQTGARDSWWYTFRKWGRWILRRITVKGGPVESKDRHSAVTIEEFVDVLRGVSEIVAGAPRPAVLTIFIDEVDSRPDEIDNFTGFLRQIIENAKCPVVFILSGLPSVWSRLRAEHGSMLRSVLPIKLKPFDGASVDFLIDKYLVIANPTGSIPFTATAEFKHKMRALSGGHPDLVQALGHRCIEELGKTTLSPTMNELQLSESLLERVQHGPMGKFFTDFFPTWFDDVDQATRKVLLLLADQQLRGVRTKKLVMRGLVTAGHNADELHRGIDILEEWGYVDNNSAVRSLALLNWLTSRSKQLQAQNP